MLEDLMNGTYIITCNFDILELALRRIYEELRVLIPDTITFDPPGPNGYYGVPDPRVYEVIQDPEARDIWNNTIGRSKCFVHYDIFMDRIIAKQFPSAISNPRFSKYLRFLLNFPSSKIVTTYRFNALNSIFGPFKQLAVNFDHFVLRPGFVGLVNLIFAEEILTKCLPNLKNNTVLIRYSRVHPEVLAFTSIDITTKKIEHRRNIDYSGRPVPISIFLEKAFPKHDLIPMGIGDEATTVQNSFVFARQRTPYFYTSFDPNLPFPPISPSSSPSPLPASLVDRVDADFPQKCITESSPLI
jgi:hypothetical protein